MKAVVWTDVFQFLVMAAGMAAVIIKVHLKLLKIGISLYNTKIQPQIMFIILLFSTNDN